MDTAHTEDIVAYKLRGLLWKYLSNMEDRRGVLEKIMGTPESRSNELIYRIDDICQWMLENKELFIEALQSND